MEEKNVDVQDVDLEQEEEETTTDTEEETHDETSNSVTISKDKFKAMQRKAMAYDATKKTPTNITNKKENTDSDAKYERLELKVEGYPDEVINDIIKLGGKKALSNPLIKKAVDDLVEQYKAEKATNIASSTQSEFDKKYTKEDLKSMPTEELEKILPHKEE